MKECSIKQSSNQWQHIKFKKYGSSFLHSFSESLFQFFLWTNDENRFAHQRPKAQSSIRTLWIYSIQLNQIKVDGNWFLRFSSCYSLLFFNSTSIERYLFSWASSNIPEEKERKKEQSIFQSVHRSSMSFLLQRKKQVPLFRWTMSTKCRYERVIL